MRTFSRISTLSAVTLLSTSTTTTTEASSVPDTFLSRFFGSSNSKSSSDDSDDLPLQGEEIIQNDSSESNTDSLSSSPSTTSSDAVNSASKSVEENSITKSAVNAFHQKLLVCNACPSWGGASIMKNEIPTKSQKKLKFNECRYIDGKIKKLDRLTFRFEKEGVQGTFEIDELPQADSQLLLIVQKSGANGISVTTSSDKKSQSDKTQQINLKSEQVNSAGIPAVSHRPSNMLAFQSFAFAPSNGVDNAQVAFLNAIGGDNETHLRMQDSLQTKKAATREESVMFNRVYAIEEGKRGYVFNRVYAIEEGNYDVVFGDKTKFTQIRRSLALHGGKDYVVLKTGTEKHPHLLVFPDDLNNSSLMSMSLSTTMFLNIFALMGPILAIALMMMVCSKNGSEEDDEFENYDKSMTSQWKKQLKAFKKKFGNSGKKENNDSVEDMMNEERKLLKA